MGGKQHPAFFMFGIYTNDVAFGDIINLQTL